MKNLYLIFLLLFATWAQAANIGGLTDNTLNLGGGNVSKKINWKGTPGWIGYDATTGKNIYSNDGTVIKNLGSGSGGGDGGTPINDNGSFEDGTVTGWANSGGTFSQQTYTNGTENDLKYARLVASTTGQYIETTLKAIPDYSVGGCLGKIDYNTADASGVWLIRIYDSSANLLKEVSLDPKTWQSGYAPFPCPTVGTTVKMRIVSSAAGTINVDRAYVGKENRTFQVAQAQLAGESYFAGSLNCLWTRTSSTVGSFTADADCPGPTVVASSMGVWSTADTDLPKQTVTNLPAGRYRATFRTWFNSGSTSNVASIFDGATSCEPIVVGNTTGNSVQGTVSCIFDYASAGTRTFELLGGSPSSSINSYNGETAPRASMKFTLEYWPTGSQTALVPEAQDWFIDVNIGGAYPSLGTAAVSSYSPINDPGLDLVHRPGSATAEIACASGTASTGLTCSSNENFGIAFTPPTPGYYEVCADFSHYVVSNTAGTVTSTFELIETSNTATTIIQEGGTRVSSGAATATYTSNVTAPHKICGNFYFASTSKRTIRVMYEQAVTGTIASSALGIGRDAASGQADARFVVRPFLSSYQRPYLAGDQVVTKGVSNVEFFSVSYGATINTICSVNGACAYLDQIGNSVVSISRTAQGLYTMVLAKTYSKIKCSLTAVSGTANGGATLGLPNAANTNTLSFSVGLQSTANYDSYGTLHCQAIP